MSSERADTVHRSPAESVRQEPWTLRYSGLVVAVGSAATVGVGVLAIVAGRYGWFASAGEPDGDGIRRALLSIAAALGAVTAGLLAWGRLELSRQQHQLDRQADARAEAAQQLATRAQLASEKGQVTERYTRAIEQLGSSDTAVRLGALYALEALAMDSTPHRRTICDVICGYARHHSLARDAAGAPIIELAFGGKEGPVRTDGTAEDLRAAIAVALRLPPEWQLPTRDLRGVVVYEADFYRLNTGSVDFSGALFKGAATFDDSVFSDLTINDATFESYASFERANLGRLVFANNVTFHDTVYFDSARFGYTVITSSTFDGEARFTDSRFDAVEFDATFNDFAIFDNAIIESADFTGAKFLKTPSFQRATFKNQVTFDPTNFPPDFPKQARGRATVVSSDGTTTTVDTEAGTDRTGDAAPRLDHSDNAYQ